MNLINLCAMADSYYIAEHKAEINQNYLSSSELIYTDGECEHHINRDGYIEISNITNANYIVFMDQAGNVFLSIYKYILDVKYKDVLDALNQLRAQTGMYKHNANYEVPKNNLDVNPNKIEPLREDDEILKLGPDELVNVNSMKCSICGSTDFIEPFKYDYNWNIKCQCKKCNTIYTLIPSKYYLVKSKKLFNKLEDNVITVKINKVDPPLTPQEGA